VERSVAMKCSLTLVSAGMVLACCGSPCEAQTGMLYDSIQFSHPPVAWLGFASRNERRARRMERREARRGFPIERHVPSVPRASGEASQVKESHSLLTAAPGNWMLLPTRGVTSSPERETSTPARDRRTKPESSSTAQSAKKESSKDREGLDNLPFAEPVPGKKGYVRLTGKNSGYPEIDVRGIAQGTPVEVPDPVTPGRAIRFRVP
jgi:hypothetical protein